MPVSLRDVLTQPLSLVGFFGVFFRGGGAFFYLRTSIHSLNVKNTCPASKSPGLLDVQLTGVRQMEASPFSISKAKMLFIHLGISDRKNS